MLGFNGNKWREYQNAEDFATVFYQDYSGYGRRASRDMAVL